MNPNLGPVINSQRLLDMFGHPIYSQMLSVKEEEVCLKFDPVDVVQNFRILLNVIKCTEEGMAREKKDSR